jgi:hypothetical protein
MIGQDLHSTLSYQRAISPVTLTNVDTAQVGQWIDMADLMGLEFVIATGALTDADATFVVLVEESDDQAAINAVADADLLPTPNNITAVVPELQAGFTFANDDAIRSIGYVGIKRYARITITPSGNNTGSASFAAIAIGRPRSRGTVTGI